MNNKFKDIYEILKKDRRLVSEDGNLLKNRLCTLAMSMDETLLEILVSHDITKDLFFKSVNNVLVFDKVKFSWVIDSKDFLPDSYTAFKNKIMLTDDKGNSIKNSSDVVLSFPFKDCILEADSTKEKEEREEVFLNEILMKKEIDTLLAPKVFTNAKKCSLNNKEDICDLSDDDNLIIKGNNLLALYSLIPRYKGRIKCMYWDILYNTDNDEVPYNDSFKHSSWLTMMKNRLEVAKTLLSNDGLIFLQCDDNEMAYLKVLCDEVFERQNCVNTICVKMSDLSGPKMAHIEKKFPKIKEYILIYKKKDVLLNPIKVTKKEWDNEYKTFFLNLTEDDYNNIKNNSFDECGMEEFNKKVTDESVISLTDAFRLFKIKKSEELDFCIKNSYRIARSSNSSSIKKYLDANFTDLSKKQKALMVNYNGQCILCKMDYDKKSKDPRVQYVFAKDTINSSVGDIWYDINTSGLHAEGGVKLSNGKKPEKLIQRIIECSTKEGDIVLDAFLGSGTTASVAHKMNRRYIGIEQLSSHMDLALKRLDKVIEGEQTGVSKDIKWSGGGSFVYCELKSLSQEFVDKIFSCSNDDLNKLYNELKNNEFVTYRVNINKLEENQEEFNYLTEEEKRKFLIQVIDKNLLYVNYSEIDDESYNISEEDKKFNHSFYKKEV